MRAERVVHSDREWDLEVVLLALPLQHAREQIARDVEDPEALRVSLPNVLHDHQVESQGVGFGSLDLSRLQPQV